MSKVNNEVRKLDSVKSNLGPPPEPLHFKLVGAGEVARVEWVTGSAIPVRDEDKEKLEIAEKIFS